MRKIKLPQVVVPRIGLYDLFLKSMASAMKVTKEEAEIIMRQR